MPFTVFGHVKAQQRLLAAEKSGGKGFAELCLTNARGTEKEKDACGTIGIFQSDPAAPDRAGNRTHRFVLADYPAVQVRLQFQQALAFRLSQICDRNTCPAGYHGSHILRRNPHRKPFLLPGLPLTFQIPAEIVFRVT